MTEAFWSFFCILFGFLCAQVSSGNCETMESWKFAILSVKPRSHVSILIYRSWANRLDLLIYDHCNLSSVNKNWFKCVVAIKVDSNKTKVVVCGCIINMTDFCATTFNLKFNDKPQEAKTISISISPSLPKGSQEIASSRMRTSVLIVLRHRLDLLQRKNWRISPLFFAFSFMKEIIPPWRKIMSA